MKPTSNLITLTCLTLLSGFSYGQNRFVSNTGNDASNDCTLPGNPCETIGAAISMALSGDSVIVESGTYSLTGTLNISSSDVTLTAMDSNSKPIITSNSSDVINISAENVTISNFIFRMGLTSGSGMRGIVGLSNFNGANVSGNEFLSTKPTTFFSTGMVFGAYAILFYAPNAEINNVIIDDNLVGVESSNNDVFGRGIGIGFNSGGTSGPGGTISNNDLGAFYPIQSILLGYDMTISDNQLKGTTMINSTKANATATFENNTFDAVSDQFATNLYALLDIRATDAGSVIVQNSDFINYMGTAIFSMASRNISVLGNTFTPSVNADKFISVMANTKLQTTGTQGNSYSDGITLQGNTFNSGMLNKGTAIFFSDHYGANTPAFATTIVGGVNTEDKNTFDVSLGNYIQLDSLTGSSDQVLFWNPSGFGGTHTPATTMQKVSQDVTALAAENNYGFTTTQEIEDKNTDSEDHVGLGKVILGYVSPAGINENNFIAATVFPNPASDELNVVIDSEIGTAIVEINDALGNSLYSSVVNMKETINVSSFRTGVYFVTVKTADRTFVSRFVKK